VTSESPEPPADAELGALPVLPRGWGPVLLVVVALLVALGWYVGREATPPSFERPAPSPIRAAPPPSSIPD
jgi:hypothetical protein